MSDHTAEQGAQQDLFETDSGRALLDQLLIDSRLYTRSQDYKELLDFVVRLPNVAPFNAMLLQIQKPGLTYVASAYDWAERFGRQPKEGARPLLILWPFGPVALVYDEMDTEGKDLPTDVASFFAHGEITKAKLAKFETILKARNIDWRWVDTGDAKAGSIRVVHRASDKNDVTRYRIHINQNHSHPTQFATLAHELAHLYLGHLGRDKKLSIPARPALDHPRQELEAEVNRTGNPGGRVS